MAAVTSDCGMVLHRRIWRETSALLDVLTPNHGRIGIVVKGYRKRKNLSGMLEPFRELQLVWSGRGEMYTLNQAEANSSHWRLTGQRLYCGLYLNELLWRLLPRHDAHPNVYRLYQQTLDSLLAPDHRVAQTLRIFEKHLVTMLGFGLLLDIEADQTTAIDADAHYLYDPEHGARLSPQSQLGDSILGASLLALHDEKFSQPGQLADARRLLRSVIQYHLGSVQLNSYRLLK